MCPDSQGIWSSCLHRGGRSQAVEKAYHTHKTIQLCTYFKCAVLSQTIGTPKPLVAGWICPSQRTMKELSLSIAIRSHPKSPLRWMGQFTLPELLQQSLLKLVESLPNGFCFLQNCEWSLSESIIVVIPPRRNLLNAGGLIKVSGSSTMDIKGARVSPMVLIRW